MKLVIVCALTTILLVVCCQGHAKPKKGGKSACKKCHSKKCEDYNKETQYCCKHSKYGKCCQGHVHDKLNCSGGGRDTAADYCNCQNYYECHYMEPYHLRCPVGGAWTNNSSAPACLKLYDPKRLCGKRRYKPKKHVSRFIEVKFIIRDSTASPPNVLDMFSGVVLQAPLYNIMLNFKATREDFTFQTDYNAITWRSIRCINGICAVSSYQIMNWHTKHNGESFKVGEGITTYIPQDNDTILFDYRVSTGGHMHGR